MVTLIVLCKRENTYLIWSSNITFEMNTTVLHLKVCFLFLCCFIIGWLQRQTCLCRYEITLDEKSFLLTSRPKDKASN